MLATGDDLPSRVTMSKRPGRSVTSILPSGRNASPHGWTSPRAIVSTLRFPALEGNVCADAGVTQQAARATKSTRRMAKILSRKTPNFEYAKVSEKLRGARCAERHGGENDSDRDAKRERCDQRGQGVVRRIGSQRRKREAGFGRAFEHRPSRSMQPSTVPYPQCVSPGTLAKLLGNKGKPVKYG
jgi:hypothetical protein